MQQIHWTKCQDLFEQSILLDATQRETLLQRECAEDIKLFEQLLHLLDAHDHSTNILQAVRCNQLTLTPRNLSQSLIGPYQIVSKLGSGCMGVVYKAFDIRLERYLALKFLPQNLTTDQRAKKRLLREAKAASALSHQHLCTVYDIEETDDGQIYIAMAYYEGKNFDTLISAGSLTLKQAITVTCQIASGLIAAHAKSIIHRDIKPANLILNGNRGIKILDFGNAKFADIQNTDTAIQGGTVAYMSPEHIRGEKVDLRTDIWSTAIILFEMISGKPPFTGNTLPETMHRVVNDPTPCLSKYAPGIPKSLDSLIFKALTKNINDRYQTMTEFLTDLEDIAKELDPHDSKPSITAITDDDNDSSRVSNDLTINNSLQSDYTPAENSIEIVCTTISLANYDYLNEALDPEIFQQLVGIYLKGIKQRVSRHNGLIKTLVGNTIVCEFNYDPELQHASLRSIKAAWDIHRHIQDIANTNSISLNCFITITEVSCSEFDILEAARQLSPIAYAMDIFATESVYHSIKSDYTGVQIDSTQSDSLPVQRKMWLIRADLQPSESKPEIVHQAEHPDKLISADDSTRERLKKINKEEIPDGSIDVEPALEPDSESSSVFPPVHDKPAEDMTFVADHILASDSDQETHSQPDPELHNEQNIVSDNATYQGSYVASNNFIGRKSVLLETEKLLTNCLASRRTHTINITGANGVGKTRLVAEIQSMAQQLGFSVHEQINVEHGSAEGLQLFSKICKSILSKSCGQETHAELSLLDYAIENNIVNTELLVYLYDLLGLTPDKGLEAEAMSTDYPTWVKQRNQVMLDIMSFTADSTPLLILVEDIQWAGPYNVESFIDILSRCSNRPIITISTSNRDNFDIQAMLKKQLKEDTFSVFELAALDHAQAEQLARQTFEMTTEVLNTLLQAANGMPLKIIIMAKYFEATGKTDFPTSVAELIMDYLSALADEDIQALWAASIIGGIFPQSCIRYLIDKPEYECQILVAIGLISTYGQLYIFSHPLIYRAVYDTMEDETKLELHKQAAEWYAYVDNNIRAEHLDRADDGEALAAYFQAATHLADIMHLEDAKKSADRGLELATLTGSEQHREQFRELRDKLQGKLDI